MNMRRAEEVAMAREEPADLSETGTGPGGAKGNDRLPPAARELLERFPALRREPHLAAVHFPLAFPMAAPLFNVLYLLRPRRQALEKSAFYMVALGAVAAPVAILTGLFTWWLNFNARVTKPIKIKIAISVALEADLLVLLVWRLADEEVMTVAGRSRVIYMALAMMMPAFAFILGRVGGRLSGHR